MAENSEKYIKPTEAIAAMEPYSNSPHSGAVFGGNAEILKLDSNETHIPPSPKVIKALTEFVQKNPINWYPDVESRKLREKLSAYTHFPADFIQTFNGSDNALECIARTYVEKGDEVVICSPTYDHFRVYVESCGGKTVPVYGNNPFEPKPRALMDAVNGNTKIIYISNPNNPTGALYSQGQLESILEHAKNALVIADEAYYEFCGSTAAALVDHHSNIIVTRSFSKSFGLAGLRCGYVIAHPSCIKHINKVRIGKNINSLAQVAAIAALDDLSYTQRYIDEVNEGKKWLVNKLESENIHAVDTPANFIMIRTKNPKKITEYLESQGIYVRNRSHVHQLDGYIRITTAPVRIMEQFWGTFKNIPQEYL